TAPALLVGLGARIILDTVNRVEVSTISDIILLGVWQGVALQYAGKNTYATVTVGLCIALKLLYDFNAIPDVTRCIASIIGTAIGVIGTDLLSSQLDHYLSPSSKSRTTTSNSKRIPRSEATKKRHISSQNHNHNRHRQQREQIPEIIERERLVQFKSSVEGWTTSVVGSDRDQQALSNFTSDITSLDSKSALRASMTPLEREISVLRTRASLADSERRRCREERQWALSQGNTTLAHELKANYKKFKALMEECHQKADKKLLEAAKDKELQKHSDTSLRDQVARTFMDPKSGPSPSTQQQEVTQR
ncbi:hypothetical protein FA15DRAFT_574384, partial [Coprinopsis marcescibilis]